MVAIVAHTPVIPRSPHFEHVRAVFLHLRPYCEICGRKAPAVVVEVHHEYPFDMCVHAGRPDLELDARNFVGLCRHADCMAHPLAGHLRNFKTYNPHLAETIDVCRHMTPAEIVASPHWIFAEKRKPKTLAEMTPDDLRTFRATLDKKFPVMQAAAA